MAKTISDKVLEYNEKAPNALFLIGGGSQIPAFSQMIANKLNLSDDRVVVKGREVIKNIKFTKKILAGPEAITPFGIAFTAKEQKNRDFVEVLVNDKKVRIFNSKKLVVSDALILVGYDASKLDNIQEWSI